jgi:large subunit ribosomal protein L13
MAQHVRTYSPKASELDPQWRVIDAAGQTLGRLSTQIATVLRGKDKPTFTTHMTVGDYVIVVNAEKVVVTGLKAQKKVYYRHSGYPQGLRTIPYQEMLEKHPERIIQHAVKGMLPHNRLGRQLMRRLHVYAGPEHPHAAQVRAGQGKDKSGQSRSQGQDAKPPARRRREQQPAESAPAKQEE